MAEHREPSGASAHQLSRPQQKLVATEGERVYERVGRTRPARYEFATPSCDDWGETFERDRALESTTYTQMLSRDDSTIRAIAGSSKRVLPLAAKEMKNMPSSIPDVVAWVGLDWADQQHEGRLQAVGSPQVEPFVLPQRPEALQEWVGQLRTRFPLGRIALAVEQSRGPLVYALMGQDFLLLYPVPPKTLADYRQAFFSSGAKSDPEDADLLLELVRCHADRLRVWQPDDAQTRQIQMLGEHRRTLVEDRTALTNRLTSLLKQSFPQALEWAGELSKPRACEFLRRWPSLHAVQQAHRSQVRHFYLQYGGRDINSLDNWLDQIRQAQPLTSDPAVLEASTLMVRLLAQQVSTLASGLQEVDQAIAQLFAQHRDQSLWDSFPGAGPVLAPRLLAAFGADRQRYQNASEVQQFSGIAPVTARSGKSCWVHWRWACPKFLRQSFHEFAAHSRRWSPWARAYYEQQIEKGAEHHAAVRALAFKWIRILYRCWQDRTSYDEQRYLQALQRRGSPLVKRLQAQAALSAPGGTM
jgi:transposase